MERNSSGALRAPGASGGAATFLRMLVCRRYAASHARLLARSGAAAFGRTGASGATRRGLRPHCDSAESGFIGRRRRLGRALYPLTDARFECSKL